MERKEKMYSIVEEWSKSDLSRIEFVKAHGITESILCTWRKRYEKEKAEGKLTPSFIEITPPTTEPETELKPKIEIELPEGIHIKIY